jgi:hypothetical protein
MTPTSTTRRQRLRRMASCTLAAVAWIAAPGPALAAKAELTTETEQAFWKGDFAALDRKNEVLKHGRHFNPDGSAEIEDFRRGLNSVLTKRVEHSEAYLREMDALTLQWATAHPASSLAHVLHAQALVTHAWSFRGNGFAKEVPPQAWADFRAYLQRAVQYLNAHADVALSDSSAHELLLTIGMGLD